MVIEYRIFSWLVEIAKENRFFLRIKKALISTRSKTLYSLYLARMFFYTFISFLLGLILCLIPLNLPKDLAAIKFLFPILFPITTFFFFYFNVLSKENSYKTQIENNLIYFISHLMSIAESNITPYSAFKILSKFEEYGALSKEIKEIINRVESYGEDFITALREVARTTPSSIFSKILNNIASIIESGGDLKTYLKSMYDHMMFDWKIKREDFLQKLGTISEIYVGLVISSPLFIVSMIVVMAAIQVNIGSVSLIDVLKIFTYLILPFLNLIFLIIIKGIEVEI